MRYFILFSLLVLLCFANVESKATNTCYDTKCKINLDCLKEGGVIGLKRIDYGFKADPCSRSKIDCSVTDTCCEPMDVDCFEPFDSTTMSDALNKCHLKSSCAVNNTRAHSIDCQDVTSYSSYTKAEYECVPVNRIMSTIGKKEHFTEFSHLTNSGENFKNFTDVQCTVNSAGGVRVNVEIQQLFLSPKPTLPADNDCNGKLWIKGAIGQSVYCENGNVNSLDLDDYRTPLTVTLREIQGGDYIWLTFTGEHDIICEDSDGLKLMKGSPGTTGESVEWRVVYTAVGIICGAVIIVLVTALIVFLWHRKHRSYRQEESVENKYTAIPMASFVALQSESSATPTDDQTTKDEKQKLEPSRKYDEVRMEPEEIPIAATSSEYNHISEFKENTPEVDFKNYDHIPTVESDKRIDTGEYDHVRSVTTQPDVHREATETSTSEVDEDPNYHHLR